MKKIVNIAICIKLLVLNDCVMKGRSSELDNFDEWFNDNWSKTK